jgi:hypothetical protein
MTDRKFDRNSWLVLGLALIVLVVSWTVVLWYASVPADGWRYAVNLNQPAEGLVVEAKVGSWASPLATGDIVLAIEGQPAEEIILRVFALTPARPANWVEGGLVAYTVLREGQTIELSVPIQRFTALELLSNMGGGGGIDALLYLLFIPAMTVLGALVFFLRPRYAPAQLLLLFGFALSGNFVELGPPGVAELWHPLIYFLYSQPTFYSAWQIFILPVLAHLLLIFPTVKRPLRSHKLLSMFILYVPAQVAFWIVYFLFRSQPPAFQSAYLSILSVQALAIVVVCAAALVHSFLTIREPVARAQLQWMAVGLMGGFLLGAMTWLLGEWVGHNWLISAIGNVGFLLMPVCLAVAILRYRLFDIAILINRALVYGTLTAILAAVFFGSVVLLQAIFTAVSRAPNTALVTVMSTLAIAALFTPLRSRLQAAIDRRFYRHKYDAVRALQAFATGARDQVELDSLADRLLAVVDETMRPTHATLWLKSEASLMAGTAGDNGPA